VISNQTDTDKAKTLETIFEQNADINIIDSNGWTALHHAAYLGDIKSVG
jgi:ankyrin repeat protein